MGSAFVALHLYARVVALVLLAIGVIGFSGLWGFGPLSSLYHAGVGALFAYAGFFERDTATVRQIVGGLGVLLLVITTVTVLVILVWFGRFDHGSIQTTSLALGVGSILAARYLPGERVSMERRSRDRRRM